MNKFKGVTVLHIDDTDYIKGRLRHLVERETVTADVVIDGGKVIKSRVFEKGINNERSGKLKSEINQLENAQKLNAIINALFYSWIEIDGDDIETLISMASDYASAIKTHLTVIAEGENNENVQR
ncbi:TPA: hypothetical protein ACJG4C_003899 [Salmonella enterica subsp. diarizonae serovar 61:r:z53]